MNISSEIFTNDGSNSSSYLFYRGIMIDYETSSIVGIITVLLGFPFNFYMIWLIVRGAGNGLAAEFFSLNLAVCEIFICMESIMGIISYKVEHFWIFPCFLEALAMIGRPLFQCLMCVERYLAVVHPVKFLKYKPLRYRVICSVIVWMSGFVSGGFSIMTCFFSLYELYFSFFLSQFFIFLSIQLFCCLAVLRALKQSGPGERGREIKEENPMKRRAFYIILINAVTMLFIYIPFVIFIYVMLSSKETPDELMVFGYVCFTLSGLVQPLLFLHRVGKLPFMN